MFHRRRPLRPAPRPRALAIGGALAALAVIGGGTVVAGSGPTDVTARDIRLTQNAPTHEMQLGAPVDLDLEPVVARAAGGTVPEDTNVQVTGLPDGLVQNDWVISGTPTRAGEYDVLITVSDSGRSESERVTIAVTEDGAAAGATVAAEEAGEPTAGDDSATGPEATTEDGETADGETADGEVVPTLSAVPGRGPTDDGAGDGVGDGTGAGRVSPPDQCSIVGGEAGDAEPGAELDATALATALAPILTGDGEGETATSGLTGVLLDAIVGRLPTLLGESESDAGSAGVLLCAIPPALLGGSSTDTEGTSVPTGGAGEPVSEVDGLATGGATGDGLGAQAATAAGISALPAALVGLLGADTGSLGD